MVDGDVMEIKKILLLGDSGSGKKTGLDPPKATKR